MILVSWNAQWCRGLDGAVDPRRIVEGARTLGDFDVLCLQEIASGFADMPGSPGDQPAEIAALLPGFHLVFGAAVDRVDEAGRSRRFGNLIATRLPIDSIEHHRLPWPADAGVPSMPRMCTVATLRDPALGAVRVMTAHLEYYSRVQRMAQAVALRELQAQACERAAAPPQPGEAASPFAPQLHTDAAILCGDFNFLRGDPEFHALTHEYEGGTAKGRWHDAWPLANGARPPDPTFCVHEHANGPVPIACDFVMVGDPLARRVGRVEVDLLTQASDHQPVLIELA